MVVTDPVGPLKLTLHGETARSESVSADIGVWNSWLYGYAYRMPGAE